MDHLLKTNRHSCTRDLLPNLQQQLRVSIEIERNMAETHKYEMLASQNVVLSRPNNSVPEPFSNLFFLQKRSSVND